MNEFRIIRDMLLIVAAVMALAISSAEGRLPHLGVQAASTAPVLQNVAVNFGADTPTGRGGVWLDSQDNSQYGTPTSGLDVLTNSGTAAVSFTVTQTGGTAGHFTLIAADTPVGSTAITPVPNSTGQGAHLNGGPYTFAVTAKDSNGHVSNTATLTYNIIPKAANFGTNDANSFNNVQAGFGGSAGYQLLISTGFQRGNKNAPQGGRTSINFSCPVLCTVGPADPARPALQADMEVVSTASNIDVNGLTCTGDISAANVIAANNACWIHTSTTNGIQWHNNKAYFNAAMIASTGSGSWACAIMQGPNFVFDHNECYGVGSGVGTTKDAANGFITYNDIRGWSSDCITPGSTPFLTITDNLCAAPTVAKIGIHVDCLQISANGTPNGLVVKRNMCVTAEGNSYTQGPLYNQGLYSNLMGYISSGAGVTTPGKVITLTTGNWGGQTAATTGSQLYSPGLLLGSDNATIASGVTNNGTTAVLNLASNMSIGSPGSPVPFYTYGLTDLVMDMNIFMSATTNGYVIGYEQGTSLFSHFGYASQVPGNPYATTFLGTITGGTTLTIPGPVSGLVGVENGSSIKFPGCVGGSNTCANGGLTASGSNCANGQSGCTFVLSVSQTNQGPIAMTSSPATPWTGANPAIIKQDNSNTAALHGGTFTRSNGWSQSGIAETPGPSAPANTTDTNVFSGATTPGATAFANGNPQTQAEAISAASWAAMSNAALRAQICHIWLQKVGGPLDLGGGQTASPMMLFGGVGGWADGTLVAGCS